MRRREKPAVAVAAAATARVRIQHKLTVLAKYKKRGVPAGKSPPTSLNTFADWADEEPGYGLKPVVRIARNTLRLANPDLKAHAEVLVEYIRTTGRTVAKNAARKEARKTEVERLRASRDELQDQVKLLTSQWHALDSRIEDLERDLASARSTIRYLTEERDELRRCSRG
jgi:cell division protein FtsB